MNLRIHQKELMSAIAEVMPAVAKGNTQPILKSILIKAEGDKLTLTSSNLEISISHTINAEVSKPGKTAIDAIKLSQVVKELSGVVTLSSTPQKLKWETEQAKGYFNTLNPDDFPSIPEIHGVEIEFDDFGKIAEVVDRALSASSKDSKAYPYLSGVCLQLKNGRLSVMSTDNNRAFRESISVDIDDFAESLIDGDSASIFVKTDGKATLILSNNLIKIKESFTTKTLRSMDAKQFPLEIFDKLFPRDGQNTIVFNRKEMSDAFRLSLVFSSYSVIKIENGEMTLEAAVEEEEPDGNAKKRVNAKVEGGDCAVKFNSTYFTDLLKKIPDEEVTMYLNPVGKISLLFSESSNWEFAVAPIR